MLVTVDEDFEQLLAIEVLVLLEVNDRLVPRDGLVFVVATNFTEQLLVLGYIAELVQGLAGRGSRRGEGFAVDVDANGVADSWHSRSVIARRGLIRSVYSGLTGHCLDSFRLSRESALTSSASSVRRTEQETECLITETVYSGRPSPSRLGFSARPKEIKCPFRLKNSAVWSL